MLGAAPTNFLTPADALLKSIAEDRGKPEEFEKPHVSVFMGEPGKTVPDPVLRRRGAGAHGLHSLRRVHDRLPARREKYARQELPLPRAQTRARAARGYRGHQRVAPPGNGDYRVEARFGRVYFWRKRQSYRAKNVIFSARRARHERALAPAQERPRRAAQAFRPARLEGSHQLRVADHGDRARTPDDHSKGIAINSLLQTDEHSHLEMVRYGDGSGFFRMVMVPHLLSTAPALVRFFQLLLVRPAPPDPGAARLAGRRTTRAAR